MRRGFQEALVAPVAVIAVALVACNRSEPQQPANNTAAHSPAAAATAPAEPRGDTALTTAVQARFYADARLRGQAIDVSAESGTIVLRGTVPDQAAKEQAVTVARGVEGVTNVNDQLQVRDPSATAAKAPEQRPDGGTSDTARADDVRQPWWITTKIQAQYFADADVKPWNVDVTTASNGVVTLEGTVDSAEAKNEAVRIARATDGVTRVEDRLTVDVDARRTGGERNASELPAIPVTDAWLTAKVQAKYFLDDEMKGRNIDVHTRNGAVTLTGSVANEAERRQAIAMARNTDGVREVTDKLRVDTTMARPGGAAAVAPSVSGQPGATTPADSAAGKNRQSTRAKQKTVANLERPDAWITMKIQSKYFLDAEVKGHAIDVDTSNGVVTLRGRVDSAEQRAEAEQIARETEGVTRVDNQLTFGAPS